MNNYPSLLRLTVILCLFYLCIGRVLPGKIHTRQDGIGGGSLPDTVVTNDANILSPGLLSGEPEDSETVISEIEYLSKPRTLLFNTYTIKKGDLIGNLALDFGLYQGTLISVNSIKNTRTIQIDQVIRIPNQDGILYTVNSGDTLEKIAEKHKADVTEIKIANELFSDSIHSGTDLFIPGAKLDSITQAEVNGDLFAWPIRGRISSGYGYRSSPFTGVRQFHSGLDISSPSGTPVRAAMPGRVSAAGWDNSYGNYVLISHHSGYRTMYAHLSVIRVKSGAYVGTGERIGDVGSTGLSTGPHLHFTVYKNGRTVNPQMLMR
jgi:murein DD-endopeptidase MepM/ murein hydrolase activator NlpD